MRGYALAGDEIHVNNSRYMMAHTAAETGIELDRAARWAAECVDYARSIGNEHELAHARLVQATLGADPPGELDAARRQVPSARRPAVRHPQPPAARTSAPRRPNGSRCSKRRSPWPRTPATAPGRSRSSRASSRRAGRRTTATARSSRSIGSPPSAVRMPRPRRARPNSQMPSWALRRSDLRDPLVERASRPQSSPVDLVSTATSCPRSRTTSTTCRPNFRFLLRRPYFIGHPPLSIPSWRESGSSRGGMTSGMLSAIGTASEIGSTIASSGGRPPRCSRWYPKCGTENTSQATPTRSRHPLGA